MVMELFGTLHRFPSDSVTMSPSVADGELAISFDGRLDDPNDLRAELSLPWHAGSEAIIAAAHRRWNDDFLAHLTGDFAFALWDSRTARLLLARDCFGVRPLFFHRRPEAITWSSRLQLLLDYTGCDRTPDDDYIVAVLANGGRLDVSPYAAIAAVPPANFVTFTRDGQSTRTYWRLDPASEVRLASDAEYEERFFTLFRRSVRNRLQAKGPVFAELSGGVDSSSIAAAADDVMRGEGRPNDALQTVSHIYEETAQSDDGPFIAIAERALGRPAHHFLERDARIFSSIAEEYPYEAPAPYWAGAELRARVAARVAERGGSVILSGLGGDHICWSDTDTPPAVSDHLARLRIGAAAREAREWSAAIAVPQMRILARAARLAIGARFGLRHHAPNLPPWLDPRLAKRRPGLDLSGFRLPSRREFVLVMRALLDAIRLRHSVDPSIEVRYPFADRDLVEFTFALPIEQHLRPHEMRSLQRRAMARLLPPEIAQRKSKGGPAKAIYLRLRQVWPALRPLVERERLRVVERGYADRAILLNALQRAGHGQNVNAPFLMRVLAVEFWLRKLERAATAGESPRRNPAITTERR